MFDFLGEINDSILDDIKDDESAALHAVAYKTRHRREARRAKSEAVLDTILPAIIAPGDAWHVLSSGEVDALSYLAHLLKTTNLDHVLLSTWCMAMNDVQRLDAWLATGKIKHLDAYVGEIFPNQYAAEYEWLCASIKKHGQGRVCVFRNHSKIFACRAGANAWLIESSANINTNPRTENTVITADLGLYLHHKQYFDGVRSFNRDFDNWTMYAPDDHLASDATGAPFPCQP